MPTTVITGRDVTFTIGGNNFDAQATSATLTGEMDRQTYQTHRNIAIDGSLMRRLLRFGIPNGLQFLIEGGAITVFVLIVARISDLAAAATALAFSINMFAFVPVIGLSFAITALVGQQIGNGKPELAARATWTGLWLGLAYTMVFALIYVITPNFFLSTSVVP